jgi:predicted ATPase
MVYLKRILLERNTIPSFERYPFNIPAIRALDVLSFPSPVTFLIGENGSGKSTVLEAVAILSGFNPEGGSKNFRFSTRKSHSELYRHLRAVRAPRRPRDGIFLRAESFFNLATSIEELDRNEPGAVITPPVVNSYGGVSLHEQSHGESFYSLVSNRFHGNGLYILDEPEAALSPMRQLAVLRRIYDLVNTSSQFIIATHSPILMALPGATVYLMDVAGFNSIRYEDTEHYTVAKAFLDRPDRFFKELLAE